MKHKLAQVMLERNATKRLKGKVEMDDAYLGGERPGRPGRGAAGKTPFIAAVETTDDGKPHQIILRRVKAFSKVALRKLASTATILRSLLGLGTSESAHNGPRATAFSTQHCTV
jgi:hypothetical protein